MPARSAWNGAPVTISNPKAARKLGIGMVFQHFSLFDAMTVLENIALGHGCQDSGARARGAHPRGDGAIRPRRSIRTAPSPRSRSASGSASRSCARCCSTRRLLIMDEPTSVLTPQEVEQLFIVLRQLASEGCSILYISHKLHEIKALCDTATILRGGKLVDTCDPKVETSRSMAEKMIGAGLKDITKPAGRSHGPRAACGEPALHSWRRPVRHSAARRRPSPCARAKSSASPASPATARTRCCWRSRAKCCRTTRTRSRIDGKAVGMLPAKQRRLKGLASVPEERNGHAAVPEFTLADNTILTARDRLGMVSAGMIKSSVAKTYAGEVITAFAVKALGPVVDRRLALGREPAEIHHGPRDPAEAERAGRQPADLGRRCRRRGGHPPGDRRSRREPARRSSSSARTSMSCCRSATRSPSSMAGASRSR